MRPPPVDRRWTELDRLAGGTERQRRALPILQRDLLPPLRRFAPLFVGSLPIGVEVASSDIDLACCAPRLDDFAAVARRAFGENRRCVGFEQWRGWMHRSPTHVVRFSIDGFPVELFAQPAPAHRQIAFRHLVVEQRLLELAGPALHREVVRRKARGASTEAAFADALGLGGDPFAAILALEHHSDAALLPLIRRARLERSDDAGLCARPSDQKPLCPRSLYPRPASR
ncbi:MAG: DUF4269 domain-containing protein [Acidobacteria bacterium]|nr:MAG: DUF4269 domain-containing protein [Acidobacteriota bacterium]REK03291.1 MAG: DUF4269 domain-containing protein [Acidobacteriota bacterium]